MKLRTYILLTYGFAFAVFALSLSVFFFLISEESATIESAQRNQTIYSDLAQLNLFLLKDPPADARQVIDVASRRIEKIAAAAEMDNDYVLMSRLRELRETLHAWRDMLKRNPSQSARERAALQTRLHSLEALTASVRILDSLENRLNQINDYLEIVAVVSSLAMLVLVAVAGLVLRRQIVRPLRAFTRDLTAIRETGTLPPLDSRIQEFVELHVAFERQMGALAASEFRYRRLVESMQEGIAEIGDDFTVNYANDRLCGMFRVSRDKLTGAKLTDFLSETSYETVAALFNPPGTGALELREIEWRLRNGPTLWTLTSVIPLVGEDGASVGAFTVSADITKRKRAEQALRENEERYAFAVSATNDGLWDWNVRTGENYLSPRWKAILGYRENELENVLETFLDAIHPDDRDGVEQATDAHLKRREPYDLEFRIRHKTGDYVWIHSRGQAEWSAEGAPLRMAGFITDVTARKQAEEQRERLETQLLHAQKMETIGTLAGGMAHDLNNILMPILGFADMLSESDDLPREKRAQAAKIRAAAERAAALVEQVLIFSRQKRREPETLGLASIVDEALALIRSTLPANITIVTDIDADCPPIHADAGQIHQVFVNLCVNAFHAMEDSGGTLEVSLKPFHVDAGFARAHRNLREGEFLKLSVADTGHGIDAETRERMFDPFFTTKEQGKGTGLGLATVHGIVMAHDGEITVYSQPGKGTAVNVYLPVQQGAVAKLMDEQAPVRSGTERILVVDDEVDSAAVMAEMLARQGYRVTHITDSAEALETFAAAPEDFDLMVTDLTMPGMMGDALSRKVLALRADLPILLVTGAGAVATTRTLEGIGVREVLSKPLSTARLAAAVRAALDDGKPHGIPLRSS